MRIGVFGGTFDPPHIGHLILAAEARDQLSLVRLLWVLTPDPPHKPNQTISPLAQRLELVQAAISGDPGFELSGVDIDRPGPHYALDTMGLLAVAYPGAELVYLMGGDSLSDLPQWHQPQAFLSRCAQIGVMRRPGETIDLSQIQDILPEISGLVQFIEAPLLDIAASEIRRRIRAGRTFQYFLPPAVYQIICDRNLYQTR